MKNNSLMQIDPAIAAFIKEHHVLTLASCADGVPYCSNMFYAFVEEEVCLVFTSDKKTKHIQDVLVNQQVAGSIVLETENVGKIQGLQFTGTMKELDGELKTKARSAYLRRFPYAVLSGTPLWAIEIQWAKFTDNRLGFGKKLIWEQKQDL